MYGLLFIPIIITVFNSTALLSYKYTMNNFPGRDYLISDSKYLKLNLDIPYKEMAEEAKNLREQFILYRATYETNGWYSLPIVGLSSAQPYSWELYCETVRDAANKMHYTDIAEHCPVAVNWLKNTYPSNQYARVRFMLLEAGGKIEHHIDTEHSVLGAVNIALTNEPECKWHWEDGESLAIMPGEAYLMNLSYSHSILNESNMDRYHIIVHHYDSTDEYKELVLKSMEEQNVKGNLHYSTELF